MKYDYIITNFQVTEKEIVHVAATGPKRKSYMAIKLMRLGRLTASNFGIVLNACTRDRCFVIFFKLD